jgi:hypothetical protein
VIFYRHNTSPFLLCVCEREKALGNKEKNLFAAVCVRERVLGSFFSLRECDRERALERYVLSSSIFSSNSRLGSGKVSERERERGKMRGFVDDGN